MKKLWISLLVLAGLLTFAGGAMAEDWSLSVDYSQLSLDHFNRNDPKIITIEGEYTPGSLILGFTDSALIFYRGLPSGTREDYALYGVYAGYNLIKNDAGSFGLVVTDMNWSFNERIGGTSEKYFTNSLGIGPKARFDLGGLDISLAYFYGLHNQQNHTVNGTESKNDDRRITYFEMKTNMMLSDSLGLCLTYRHSDLDVMTVSNIGMGLNWKF